MEFLIGDIPALSINATAEGAGPLGGVPWDQANSVVIPLGPSHLAAFGADVGFRDVDDDTVASRTRTS